MISSLSEQQTDESCFYQNSRPLTNVLSEQQTNDTCFIRPMANVLSEQQTNDKSYIKTTDQWQMLLHTKKQCQIFYQNKLPMKKVLS